MMEITNGIGQGDPLSMLLYILYNTDQNEDSLGYVDDIAFIVIGDNYHETTAKLKNIMEKQNGGLNWSKSHNSRFEITKLVILHTSRTIVNPEDNARCVPLHKLLLEVNNQIISEVPHYKYLGILIDSQLRWKEQDQRVVANATKWLLQFRRLTKPSTGTSIKLMRQLYILVTLPKITYGLDIWFTPPSKKPGQTKKSGLAAVLCQLQKTQQIASLAITGALQTTVHAGLLPMEYTLRKVTYRAIIRILTLPPNHLLHDIVRITKDNPPTRHASPITNLLRIHKLTNFKLETIIPLMQFPQPTNKFKTSVSSSREELITIEKNDKEKHNIYEVEIVGATLATWLIRNCPDTVTKTVSLYIDN